MAVLESLEQGEFDASEEVLAVDVAPPLNDALRVMPPLGVALPGVEEAESVPPPAADGDGALDGDGSAGEGEGFEEAVRSPPLPVPRWVAVARADGDVVGLSVGVKRLLRIADRDAVRVKSAEEEWVKVDMGDVEGGLLAL